MWITTELDNVSAKSVGRIDYLKKNWQKELVFLQLT